MSTRKTYTTSEMRALAKGRGSQFLADESRGALNYAADVIDALQRALESEIKRNARNTKSTPVKGDAPDEKNSGGNT